jgi:aspartate kinase
LPKAEGANATTILQRIQGEVGFASILYDDQIGKLSLVGAGMRSHPGITATFFAAMADAGVNIEMISTSEIRISIVCRESDLERGVKAAHTAFGLDADQVEAVVYGGTGR